MPPARRINVDLPLLLTAIALTIYGLAVVFSAGQTDVHTPATGAYRLQAIWTMVGILGAFAVSRASVRLIEWMTVPAYALTILLLVALLLGLGSGAGTATSTSGWLTIAGHRLGQPAELAKLTVVLMLARVLAQNRIAPKSMIELWKPIAHRRRAAAPHHGAGRSRHVDRVRRNLLRDAVLGRRAVAAAHSARELRSSA